MSRQPDSAIGVFGAGVLLEHLQALQGEIAGVRLARDIEFIHRMRVASRRLRSALTLFGDRLPAKKYVRWEAQVKAITRALGAARDTDVQIALLDQFLASLNDPIYGPGIRRLLLRLRQRRAKLQSRVITALDAFEDNHTVQEMEEKLKPQAARKAQVYLYTPELFQRGFDAITSQMNAFLSYEPFIYLPEKITELHAMRIAAKQLRYTLEIFAPLYENELKDPVQGVKKAQDLLGEIHDADVWSLELPLFIEKERRLTFRYFGHTRPMTRIDPGLLHFLDDQRQNREKKYHEFLAYWQEIKQQNFFENLRGAIQVPYDISAARKKVAQVASEQPEEVTNLD